jgi:DeoR/GlpR family transcriptional regulator of sugar metabolism
VSNGTLSVRTERIAAMLGGRDGISVAELAETFDVTAMTIRRDLDALAREGRVTRTHGGAILAAPGAATFEFEGRRLSHPAEKRVIARAAAELIEPGMTVILDTGTTTLEVARLLGGIPDLTVVTSSLAIASALFAVPGIELTLLGGTVNRNSPDLSGALTIENLKAFHVDMALVGADGADRDGYSTSSMSIAQVSRAIIGSADRRILLADSSKFGTPAFVRIAKWDALDHVVVDDQLAARHRRWVKKAVKDLILTPVAKDDA